MSILYFHLIATLIVLFCQVSIYTEVIILDETFLEFVIVSLTLFWISSLWFSAFEERAIRKQNLLRNIFLSVMFHNVSNMNISRKIN